MSEAILIERNCGVGPVIAEMHQMEPYIDKSLLIPEILGPISVALSVMGNVPTHLWSSFNNESARSSSRPLNIFSTDPIPFVNPADWEAGIGGECARIIFHVEKSYESTPLEKKILGRFGKTKNLRPYLIFWQIMLGSMSLTDLKNPDPKVKYREMGEDTLPELPSLVIPLLGNVKIFPGTEKVLDEKSGKIVTGITRPGTREEARKAFDEIVKKADEAVISQNESAARKGRLSVPEVLAAIT